MLLSGLILSSAQATTLRLYPNFAEVRRTVEVKNQALELDFSQSQMNGMVGNGQNQTARAVENLCIYRVGYKPLIFQKP